MIKRLWSLLNCKLNKIISLLTILFVILLFSCANARVLTKEEVANFMLNGYATYTNEPTQTIIDNVNNLMGHWQTIADKTSQYERTMVNWVFTMENTIFLCILYW